MPSPTARQGKLRKLLGAFGDPGAKCCSPFSSCPEEIWVCGGGRASQCLRGRGGTDGEESTRESERQDWG